MELIGPPGQGATEPADPPSTNMLGSYTILLCAHPPVASTRAQDFGGDARAPGSVCAHRGAALARGLAPVWCTCRLCSEPKDDQGRREHDGGRGEQAETHSSAAMSRASSRVSRLPSCSSSSPCTASTRRRTKRTRFESARCASERSTANTAATSGFDAQAAGDGRIPADHAGIHPRRARTTGPSGTVRRRARGCRRRPGTGRAEPSRASQGRKVTAPTSPIAQAAPMLRPRRARRGRCRGSTCGEAGRGARRVRARLRRRPARMQRPRRRAVPTRSRAPDSRRSRRTRDARRCTAGGAR